MTFRPLFCSSLFLFLTVVHISSMGVEVKQEPVRAEMAAWLNNSQLPLYDSDPFSDFSEDKSGNASEKTSGSGKSPSVIRAAAYSALLPGLGEYYVGHKTKAKIFFAAEALAWIGYFSFHTYGNWKEDDMIRFAADRAGASLEDKSDEFRDWVGFYEDIDQFNTLGRVSDPERDYLMDTPENHWRWTSEADQSVYRELKNSSREAYRRADFMIGAAVLNRVVSIIDAIRDARRARNRVDSDEFSSSEQKYRIEIQPLNVHQQITVTWYTGF